MKIVSSLAFLSLLLVAPSVDSTPSGYGSGLRRGNGVGAADDSRILQDGGGGLPPGAAPEIGILLSGIPSIVAELSTYETPITVRFTSLFSSMWWNCIASYSTDLLDSITKDAPAVRVLDEAMHETGNRALCVAQATATFSSLSLPGIVQPFLDAMQSLGISVEKEIDPDIAACGVDGACFAQVAENGGYNPTIMGHIVAKLAYDYSVSDGFNQLGTDDACTVNCRNYTDITGYEPKKGNSPKRWKPLLEDNEKGFFYFQQHVVPHIGQLAKFRGLPENDRTTRVASNPSYSGNRKDEAAEVIALMAQLDDTKKMQVEVFDDKLLVALQVIASFVGKTALSNYQDNDLGKPGVVLSYERLVHFIMTHDIAEYDAVVIAWKEKVNYDLVRPTSIIKDYGNYPITTWAPGGTQTFPAKHFEAYKRVMPHSEYVSGSACIFQAVEEVVLDYLEHIGLDPTFPVQFEVAAGGSQVEPGVVPENDIVLLYATIQDMAAAGSQSRLDGGMHFAESVPAAIELCTGIGSNAVSVGVGLYGTSIIEL